MWTEMLHSFYRMPAILYIAGVPTLVTLRWYKAPAGAKQLPFPSVIFSHVWDNNPGESHPGEIGEVGFPRTWDPGENHGYQGQCYRGDPSWFATGQLPALTVAPSPCLCQIPPAQAAGALVLSGSAQSQAPSCQGFFTPGSPIKLDQGDGRGFVTMTYNAGSGVYNLPVTIHPGDFIVVEVDSPLSCAGHPRVRVSNSTDPNTTGLRLTLVWLESAPYQGQWRWLFSFDLPTGFTVRLYTGP